MVGTAISAAYAASRFMVSFSCSVIIDRFTEMAVPTESRMDSMV